MVLGVFNSWTQVLWIKQAYFKLSKCWSFISVSVLLAHLKNHRNCNKSKMREIGWFSCASSCISNWFVIYLKTTGSAASQRRERSVCSCVFSFCNICICASRSFEKPQELQQVKDERDRLVLVRIFMYLELVRGSSENYRKCSKSKTREISLFLCVLFLYLELRI